MDAQLPLALHERRVKALAVSQLVRLVRETLEITLEEYWVVGEISNARPAPSGHLYFTLKDARSAINVVMFKTASERLRFKISDGMQVMIRGRVDVYEARGALQFYAEEMEPRGVGALQLAFEQLKERLEREGLFDPAHKRPLPFLPRTIGIVTALGGAALRDMLTTVFGRYPNMHVIVRPATVQGANAAQEVAQALADLNAHGQPGAIIVGRGGGSLEDLWAFNEEVVARAIYRSRIPVISAVGHEIDYTIADFVADLRAPTPTAAGQIVVPRKAELKQRLDEAEATLAGALKGVLSARRKHVAELTSKLKDPRLLLREARQRLDDGSSALGTAMNRATLQRRRHLALLAGRIRPPRTLLREMRMAIGRLTLHLAQKMTGLTQGCRARVERPSAALRASAASGLPAARRETLSAIGQRLEIAMRESLGRRRRSVAAAGAILDSLSPLKVLGRGYAVVINQRDGRAVRDSGLVEVGDELDIRLSRGRVHARTTAKGG